MELIQDNGAGKYQITAYESGLIYINQKPYSQSLIVSPTQLIANWDVNTIEDLQALQLDPILATHPKVVIIGTGNKQRFLPQALLKLFHQQHIGVECMNTRAACRTYIALISEGRAVTTGLFLE